MVPYLNSAWRIHAAVRVLSTGVIENSYNIDEVQRFAQGKYVISLGTPLPIEKSHMLLTVVRQNDADGVSGVAERMRGGINGLPVETALTRLVGTEDGDFGNEADVEFQMILFRVSL